mgnify:CR=1 FL=1
MAQEEYAYAVATVRIKENTLLGTDFLEQQLSAQSYESVRRQLVEHGWLSADFENDDKALQKHLVDSWNLLMEVAPEPELFDALVLKNDFHNLKAALKCSFTNNSPKPFFIKPCLYDTDEIEHAVTERQFDQLPVLLIDAAQNAHRVFINTQDGQYADVIIDTAALNAIRNAGRRSHSAMIDTATELVCAAANIKTVVRAIKTNKDMHFLDSAVCECDTLDKTTLIAAALKSEDALRDYLHSTPYDEAVQNSSLSALEKWFDDRLMEIIKSAKSLFFGPEPLAAYYLARETEIRNIRILLSGKRHGADDTTIRERMRNLYV